MAGPQLLKDHQILFAGGQDASMSPELISENSYHAGINVTASRGKLGPRYAFVRKPLSFPTDGVQLVIGQFNTYKNIFHSGRYQALIPYYYGGTFYEIAVINGVIFLINHDTLSASVIEIADGSRIGEHHRRVNWSDGGNYLVIFDFPAYPVIIEGTSARRADPNRDEIPISAMGTYNQNRLFISNAENEFTAGDPSGSLAAPDAPITFQEIVLPGSPYLGQIFQLPTEKSNEPITAMGFLQVTDTSTGIGPLLIATKDAIFTAQSQLPRDQWQAGQFVTMAVHTAGIAGPQAYENVNSDIYFLASDGTLRSFAMSREEQRKWARVPMSREVENWLKYSDPSLIQYGVVSYFSNRIFVTANPYRVKAKAINGETLIDVAYGGFVVLSLDNVSKLGVDSPPAWEGLWTGVRPMGVCTNNNRCFVMSKDDFGRNELYEIVPSETVDKSGSLKRKIKSVVYTRGHTFQDPFQNKETHSVELALENIRGKFDLDLKYKPAQSPHYLDWGSFHHEAPYCTPYLCKVQPTGFAPHSFREITIGAPDKDACNPVTQEFYNIFRKIQLRLQMMGVTWSLHGYKIKAVYKAQNENESVCEPYPVVEIPAECSQDWVIDPFSECDYG